MNLYYCETAAAVSERWHLRVIDGPRKLGGGVRAPTLCGLQAAWDIRRPVLEHDIEALACRGCVSALRSREREGT